MTEPASRSRSAASAAAQGLPQTARRPAQKHNDSARFAELLGLPQQLSRSLVRGSGPQQKNPKPAGSESTDRSTLDDAAARGARPARPETRERVDDPSGREPRRSDGEAQLRDPLERSLAHTFPVGFAAPHPNPEPPRSLIQLDPNLAEMIRRVAWGKTGSRSTLRLELGGKLEGAVLLLGAEHHGGVSVTLELPATEDPGAWQARLRERLEARGLSLEALEVR